MKKSLDEIGIIFLIVLQLIFPSYLLADGNNNNNINTEFNTFHRRDTHQDLGLLSKQEILYFTYENGVRKEGKRESLLDLSLDNQRASVFYPQEDLRYEYHKDSRELWIVFSQLNSKTNVREDKLAHIITDIDVTSNIVVDANMVVFATPEGIRATLINRILNCGFIEPILFPLVASGVSDDGSIKITNIKSINTDENLSKYVKDLDQTLYSGDFILELESSSKEGSKQLDYTILDKSTVIMNLRTSLIGTLFLSSFYLDRKDQVELVSQIEASLSENKDQIDEFMKGSESILNDSNSDENLLTRVLKNVASGNKLKTVLPLLNRGLNGKDPLQTYADIERFSFTAQDTQNIDFLIKEFEKQYGSISNEKKIEIQKTYFQKRFQAKVKYFQTNISEDSLSSSSWLEDLSNTIIKNEAKIKEGAVKEKNIFKKMLDSTSKLWGAFSKKLKKYLVVGGLGAIVGTAYYLIDPTGASIGLEYVSSLIKGLWNVLEYSTHLPFVYALTTPIVGTWDFIYNTGMMGTLRLSIGIGIALALYPLSLWLVKLTRLSSSKGESLWQTFFNFGIRWYAKLCYPLVKFGWDRLKQKYIYSALDIGMNPVFNGVSDSNEQVKEKLDKKLEVYSKKQDLSFITKVLAAAIVGNISELDLKALLLLESGSQMKEVASILKDSSVSPNYLSALESLIYTTLLEVATNKDLVAEIDEKELSQYIEVFLDIKNKVQTSDIEHIGVIKKAYDNFSKAISNGVIPYFLYGKQGLNFYNKYKNVVLDPVTTSIAGTNYKKDYLWSAIFYGTAAAEKFAIGALGNIEATSNQLSQLFIYGLQGAVDPKTVAEEGIDMDKGLNTANYPTKVQSFWEAFKTMFSSSPTLSTTGYLDAHAQYIKNLFVGFNVRFLADYIVRVPGMIAKGIVESGTMMSLGAMCQSAASGIFLSVFFLIVKISVTPSFVGYAIVWPYIQLAMKKNRNSVLFNKNILDQVSSFIESGIRFSDIDKVRKGVLGLKVIYAFSQTDIPSQYRKKVEEFSFDEAYNFYNYTLNNLPISTEFNPAMDNVLTIVIGSLVSSVLFDMISTPIYDSKIPVMVAVSLLGEALLYIGLTYGGLKLVSWTIRNIFNKKVDEVLDTKLIERIDVGEVSKLTREDITVIFDKLTASNEDRSLYDDSNKNDCKSLFNKEDIN